MQTLTLRSLFDDTFEELALSWIGGEEHAANILNPDAYATHAVADMIGHLNLIHKDRIQVIGRPEYQYLSQLTATRQQHLLAELLGGNPPAVIVADGVNAPALVVEACAHHGVRSGSFRITSGDLRFRRRTEASRLAMYPSGSPIVTSPRTKSSSARSCSTTSAGTRNAAR